VNIQDKSSNQNIDNTTVAHIINVDKQHHPHTSNKINHSRICVISDFISVSKKGNTLSLSEEQLSNVDVTLYIPALFRKIIHFQSGRIGVERHHCKVLL